MGLPKYMTNEWSFDSTLNFGCLGEKKVEIFYRHHYGLKSNDPFQVPEPDNCEVVAVLLEGKDIFNELSDDCIEDLEIDALTNWNS